MKGYVITLTDVQESVDGAMRCVESGKEFGVDINIFSAINKYVSMEEFKKEKLFFQFFNRDTAVFEAVVGCFLSHYNIWKNIISTNEACIILEHDAIFVNNVPVLKNADIVNLGKPSWGEYNEHDQEGIFPIFSSKNKYLLGAHGYYVTPKGANSLIKRAKSDGILPADIFIDANYIPGIKEIYPWVIDAIDDFTTIQNERTSMHKFNYSEDYKILS